MTQLPTELLLLLRNVVANFKCAPLLYKSIISWVWSKETDETIRNYLESGNSIPQSRSFLRKYSSNARNMAKLDKLTLDGLDVTFLHELLHVVCSDKVSKIGSEEHRIKLEDPTSVEYLLKEIKDRRNAVSHNYIDAADPNLTEELQDLIDRCLESAGKLYDKNQDDIHRMKQQVDIEFQKIIEDTTSREKTINLIKELIMTKTIDELESLSEDFMTSHPFPGSNNSQINLETMFHCIHLASLQMNQEKSEEKLMFNYCELPKKISHKFVIISGVPGSGKTTVMRSLYFEALKSYKLHLNSFEDNNLKLPLFIECRTEDSTSLEEFIKTVFPTQFKKFQREEIFDAVQLLDNVIFFIDGYDEINSDSEKLVKAILGFCKKKESCKCIISGRIKSSYDIEQDFVARNIRKWNHFSIEPITKVENQLKFLKAISNELDPSKVKVLNENFCKMEDKARKVFSSPLLLSLYYFMFADDFFGKISVENDADVVDAIFDFFRDKMRVKIETSNKTISVDIIMDVTSEYCLDLFKRGKYFLTEREYTELCKICLKECPEVKNIERVLDCLISPHFSLKFNLKKTYQFLHSTIHEFFAANGMLLRILRTEGSLNEYSTEAILSCLGLNVNKHILKVELKRYWNIVRLLTLNLRRIGEIPKFSKPIGEFMRRYMSLDLWSSFDLITEANCDDNVVKIALDALEEDRNWDLREKGHLKAASRLLRFVQPPDIDIWLYDTLVDRSHLIELMTAIKMNFKGALNLFFFRSHDHFEPMNEVLVELKDAKCRLKRVCACVTSPDTLTVLKDLSGRHSNLSISAPLSAVPNLGIMEGCHSSDLIFSIQYSPLIPKAVSHIPLPTRADKQPVELVITDVPADGLFNISELFNYLAPVNKVFYWLFLKNCSLSDRDVCQLTKLLHDRGFRSKRGNGSGVLRKTENHPADFELLTEQKFFGTYLDPEIIEYKQVTL